MYLYYFLQKPPASHVDSASTFETSKAVKHVHVFNDHFGLIGRTKRVRCGSCKNCLNNDCGKCKHCLDKPKFGGVGRLKQSCMQRKCLYMKPKGSVQYSLINGLYEI